MAVISVIVPVYNVEKYIGSCLESIVNQTYRDIEIIIVDDGSPDQSHLIYQKYADRDERIKVIKKVNAGVSEARNTGMEHASGEFVMFVDSDDWLEKDACEVLITAQRKNNADLVVTDAYTVIDGKKKTNRVFDNSFYSEDPDFIRQYERSCIGYGFNPRPAVKWNISGLGSPWNKLYAKRIIDKFNLHFDPYVKGIYDDNLFALHYLAHARSIQYVTHPIYNYRIVNFSLTQSYKANTLDISRRIFEKIREYIKSIDDEKAFETPFYNYVIRRFSAELGVYYFSDSNKKPRAAVFAELKENMRQEPYKSAIAKADTSRMLTAHAVTCKIAKLHSPLLLWMMFRIRRKLKKRLR